MLQFLGGGGGSASLTNMIESFTSHQSETPVCGLYIILWSQHQT